MIISGGLGTAEDARHAYEASGADAVMVARGSLGNPWIFEQLTGRRGADAERDEVISELLWVIERAEEHLGGSEPPGICASSIRGTWSGLAPIKRSPTRSNRARTWMRRDASPGAWPGPREWWPPSRPHFCSAEPAPDILGALTEEPGREISMIKKRSIQLAFLACAGCVSLWLLGLPAAAAAKTKEASFIQCVSTAVAIPDGPVDSVAPNPAASFAVAVKVPKVRAGHRTVW